MGNNGKDQGEQEPVQLDDLLDQILQKNMEDAVHGAEGLQKAAAQDLDVLADSIEEARGADFVEQEAALSDMAEEMATDMPAPPEEKETSAEEEADKAAAGNASFDEEIPPEKDEDIQVIEVEVGSEDDSKITKKDVISMVIYVIVIFLLTFFIVHFIGQRTRVSGSSMEDTLSNGDNLIVDKLSYRLSDPERFDIIIFPYRFEPETYYIKRIIGLPGETVQIDEEGNIFINGELLEEDYGLETINDPGMAISPIELGEDEYFVLGDNRNNSSDSRFSGVANVKRETIIGRAFIRIYPFNHIKLLH